MTNSLRLLRIAVSACSIFILQPLFCEQPLRPVAITHVNVIDVVAGAVRADQTVVLANGKISAVGASSSVEAPRDAVAVAAAGEYLISGLWDMHVHLRSDSVNSGTRLAAENGAMLDLFLPNGVVGISEMGATLRTM